MKPEYHFAVVDEGYSARVLPPPFQEFGAWLEADVQTFDDYIDGVLRTIEKIRSGKLESDEFDGNSMELTLSKTGAIVQCNLAYSDDPAISNGDFPPSAEMALSDFEGMVKAWRKFIHAYKV